MVFYKSIARTGIPGMKEKEDSLLKYAAAPLYSI